MDDITQKFMLVDAIKRFNPEFMITGFKEIIDDNTNCLFPGAMAEVYDIVKEYINECDNGYCWISEKLHNEDMKTLMIIYSTCHSVRASYNILYEAAKDAIMHRKGGIYPYTERYINSLSSEEAIALYVVMITNRQ